MAEKDTSAASSAPGESQSESAGHGVTRELNPWIAALANLFLPPVGHFYAGAAQRGIVIWAARLVVGAAVTYSILLLPGSLALAIIVPAAAAQILAPALDAFLVAARRRSAFAPRPYNRGAVYVAVAVATLSFGSGANAVLRNQVQAFRVPSVSMEPVLRVGDFFFLDKTCYRMQGPRRGDVVLYRLPNDPGSLFVKRVICLPGETIEIRSKQVLIDESLLREPYAVFNESIAQRNTSPRDRLAARRLGPNEYFLMGDNRDNSNDSRFSGPIDRRAILGRARFIYWSWNAARFEVRWERIGMPVR